MRIINKIIIHCSATPEGRHHTINEISQWHKARGFKEIGYHFIIYLDGSVHVGRPLPDMGAHCVGQNKDSIGICYIGGMSKDMKNPKDTRTSDQQKALIKLVNNLTLQFPDIGIYGHNDFSNKACPSFDAKKEFKR